jgi:hypothetical protein
MQYLLFFEDGDVKLVDDVSDADLSPCSWPTVVKLTDIGSGLIQAEKLGIKGEWVNLDDS